MSAKNRLRLMLGVAAIHLILVALGAARVSLGPLGPVGRPLEYYDLLSGAGSGYGFFSTGVHSQLRARFDVIDGKGQETTIPMETAASHEADLRVGHLVDGYWGDDDPDLRRALVASLAGKVFARYPRAHQVVVRVEQFDTVSMEEFHRGSRPQWSPLYKAKFAYQDRRPKE